MTYRLTYYLIPFVIAVAPVSFREIWSKCHWARKTVDGTGKAWSAIAPRLAGMSALAGGFVLMLSATTPMDAGRKLVFEKFVPPPFVEASHFLSSIAGTVMIIVSSGLLRRVQTAWWIAVLMAGRANGRSPSHSMPPRQVMPSAVGIAGNSPAPAASITRN